MSQWARGFFKEADLHARMLSKSSNEGVQTESDISLFLLLPLVLSLSLSCSATLTSINIICRYMQVCT